MALKTILGFYETTKNNRKYLSAKAREEIVIPAGARLMLFKNDRKKDEKHPDFNLLLAGDDEPNFGR